MVIRNVWGPVGRKHVMQVNTGPLSLHLNIYLSPVPFLQI